MSDVWIATLYQNLNMRNSKLFNKNDFLRYQRYGILCQVNIIITIESNHTFIFKGTVKANQENGLMIVEKDIKRHVESFIIPIMNMSSYFVKQVNLKET